MQLDTPVGNAAAFQRLLGSLFLSEKPTFCCDPGKNVYTVIFLISKLHLLESAFFLSVLLHNGTYSSLLLLYCDSIFWQSNIAVVGKYV